MMNQEQKRVFDILHDVVTHHNAIEWQKARLLKRRPELMPALVAVTEVRTAVLKPTGAGQLITLDVRARFRPYFSERRSGERKPVPPPKMKVGRIREGNIKAEILNLTYVIDFETVGQVKRGRD